MKKLSEIKWPNSEKTWLHKDLKVNWNCLQSETNKPALCDLTRLKYKNRNELL